MTPLRSVLLPARFCRTLEEDRALVGRVQSRAAPNSRWLLTVDRQQLTQLLALARHMAGTDLTETMGCAGNAMRASCRRAAMRLAEYAEGWQ